MKHLFWIICGVILVGLIAAWFFVVPTDEAREVKKKLDTQKTALLDLERRAKNGDPSGVFNAEIEDDTKKLQKDYLITEQWKRVLEPHVKKYEDQLGLIQVHLAERSQSLHLKLTAEKFTPEKLDTTQLEWYEAYEKGCEALLNRLREAGLLVVATAENGAPGSNKDLRSAVGLFTKGVTYPDPKEHPLLLTRLRMIEQLGGMLTTAQAPIADNAVSGGTGAVEERGKAIPRLVQIEWTADAPEGIPFSSLFSTMVSGRAYHLKLVLDGSMAALLAATAVLEHNPDAAKPIVLVTSASLTRKSGFTPGERLSVPAETARLNLELAILDFTQPGASK